MFKVNFAVLAL